MWIVASPSTSINNDNIDSQIVTDQPNFKQSVISIVKDKTSKVDDLAVNTINTRSSQELVVTPKGNNNALDYNILLVLLSFTTLLSIFVSFWLYRWRKVATSDKEIVVPEVFAQQLKSFLASVNYSNSKMENTIKKQSDVVSQQSNEVNKSRISLGYLNEKIREMIEVHMKLQSTLDKKEDEINRYKEGYDAKIFHNFLLRFTRVDRTFNDYIKDESVDETVRDALEDIREMMEDALAECGVEAFSPEEGLNYKTTEGVADNPKTIDTDDESKHFTIAKVLDEGYRREMGNLDYKIITKAEVKVYIYKKPDPKSNDKEQDNAIQE